MNKILERLLRKQPTPESIPEWKTVPITLTADGQEFLSAVLRKEFGTRKEKDLEEGFGYELAALKIITRVAREVFGQALISSRINPLSAKTLQYLLTRKYLRLDKAAIAEEFAAWKKEKKPAKR